MQKWMIFSLLVVGIVLGCSQEQAKDEVTTQENAIATMVTDPVCGMEINAANANTIVEYEGNQYYFCSDGCAAEFEKDPEKYTAIDHDHESHEMHQM